MKHTVEGIGTAIWDEESSYLDLGDNDLDSISTIVAKAGGKPTYSPNAHAFDSIGTNDYHEVIGRSSDAMEVDHYRTTTGRQYPPVYRVKLSIELEEVSEAEAEAYWVKRRYSSEEDEHE